MSKDDSKPTIEIDPELLEDAVKSVEKPDELSELKDKYLRLAADFDNFRKRVQKEKTDYVRYATENVIKELLPILDNFERAMEHSGKTADPAALTQGIQLILSQFQMTMSRFGLKSESALGKPFDPLLHEAVSHVESQEHPPHTVIAEMQKAYFLGDRLIRPALVTVSKGSEDASQMDQN